MMYICKSEQYEQERSINYRNEKDITFIDFVPVLYGHDCMVTELKPSGIRERD